MSVVRWMCFGWFLAVVNGSWATDGGGMNVVFILSDNQSYYEMSGHGHAVVKTPHLDALAKESVEFSHFYAPPFCSPSRAVILTGQYAMRSGVFTTIGGRSILHKDFETLADVLGDEGYRTGIFGKWHLGFSYPYRPQDRGFQEVFVHGGGGVGQLEDTFGNTHYDTTFWHNGEVVESEGFSTDTLFDQAMGWIEEHHKGRFFCYLPTPVTHSPHYGPKDLEAELRASGVEKGVGLYAQVQNLDTNVGRMVAKLKELGVEKTTALIFASDQGMSDRGAPHGGNRQTLAHDPAHHVPFFIRVPGVEPRVTGRLAGMIDFFPTVLDLLEMEVPKSCDGVSLERLIVEGDEAYPEDRTLIIQCPRGREAKKWVNASVKEGTWRLTNGEKLYDISTDPRQELDIAAAHPDVVARLRAAYEAYWADLPDPESTWSRHLLGAEECPDVVLNGMDWYSGGRPWANSHFKKPGNGKWPVTVVRDGRYVFECRGHPREADRALGVERARIQVGDVEAEAAVGAGATSVRFELELEAGEYDLQTWLGEGEGAKGALFVYVRAE